MSAVIAHALMFAISLNVASGLNQYFTSLNLFAQSGASEPLLWLYRALTAALLVMPLYFAMELLYAIKSIKWLARWQIHYIALGSKRGVPRMIIPSSALLCTFFGSPLILLLMARQTGSFEVVQFSIIACGIFAVPIAVTMAFSGEVLIGGAQDSKVAAAERCIKKLPF